MIRLAAALPLALLALAAPAIATAITPAIAHAQPPMHGGGMHGGGGPAAAPRLAAPAPSAPRALPRMAPSAPAASGLQVGGLVARQQVVPTVPAAQSTTGLLSSPPRYDSLALGHAQYADQPPPLVGAPLQGGALTARSNQARSNQEGDNAIGLGDGSPTYYLPDQAQGEARRSGRPMIDSFGSSTRIDGN